MDAGEHLSAHLQFRFRQRGWTGGKSIRAPKFFASLITASDGKDLKKENSHEELRW
jgi:hypothetical protein